MVAPISSTQKTVSKSIRPDVAIDHSYFSIIVLKIRVFVKWDTLLDARTICVSQADLPFSRERDLLCKA